MADKQAAEPDAPVQTGDETEYFFPGLGVTVQAKDLESATKKAQAEAKKEDKQHG